MAKIIINCFLLFTFSLYANLVYAKILYTNDFQTGNMKEWLTDRKNRDKVEISGHQQNKSLRLKQSSFALTPITTTGYRNIRFSATLYGFSLEKGEQCRAEASIDSGKSWHEIASLADGQDDGLTPVFGKSFLKDADDKNQILFRLANTGNDASSRCYFDDIKVTGEKTSNLNHGLYGEGRFSYPFINNGQNFSNPVATSYFEKPAKAKPASNHFEGTLSYKGNDEQYLELIDDLFSYHKEKDKKRYAQLPAFEIDFIQFGDDLIPVQRGPQSATHPHWEIMIEPGKVWDEEGDQDYSRAALPFALQEKGADCIHNGLMTFLFKSDGTISRTLFQIGSETCAYFKFDMLGSINFTYTLAQLNNSQTIIAAYQQEQVKRLPTKPITELNQRYPNIDLSGFGSSSGIHPSVMTVYGVVVDGIHYVSECNTRFGPYPYCDVMDLPSYSTAKSVNALAYMRLLKLYPMIRRRTIAELIPACDGGQWEDVTLEHALNMTTGNYVSDGFEADEYVNLRPFFDALTHADKIKAACRFERRAKPGSKWVYHTSDTYLYATAMNNFWKQKRGDKADYYDDLLAPVWDKLGLSPLMYRTRRTYDQRKQPYAGYGIIYHRGDVAKFASALLPNEKNIEFFNSTFNETEMRSALQMNENDRGLTATHDIKGASINQDFFVSARKSRTENRNVYDIHEDLSTGLTPQSRKKTVNRGTLKYKHAFWAWNIADVLGCTQPTWIPFMSGYGGITIAMMPNDIVYYYFSDNYDHLWLEAVVAANKIKPLCG